MKLIAFTVKNYRSIIEANKIPLQEDVTVLLGKNNEGKSNILMALNVAMGILKEHAEHRTNIRRYQTIYDWHTDYPISCQVGRRADKYSEFILEFKLSNEEIESFYKNIGSHLNGSLPIQIRIDSENRPKIRVIKRGKGSKPLNDKSKKIALYIAQNIEYNYIPAVRTDNESMDIIGKQIRQSLIPLGKDVKYKEALKAISDLREPILSKLANDIHGILKEFIPNIASVSIDIEDDNLLIFRRYMNYSIKIDDGAKTDLQNKGDGVKSLVALGLLKNIMLTPNIASVVAIEEPESHLHPEAIAALRRTIYDLSLTNQIIISTHNPIFVNRCRLNSNIIINAGTARTAKSIKDIREVLGVRISDNLYDAQAMLLVEGETDASALRAILSYQSPRIKKALDENILVITPLKGIKNLYTNVTILKQLICNFLIFADNDNAGNVAIKRAVDDKLIDTSNYILTTVEGMNNESELEDLYDMKIYNTILMDEYGVSIDNEFNRKDLKWACRLQQLFVRNGKMWNNNIETEIKNKISNIVQVTPNNALDPIRGKIINNLIARLEDIISI